MQVEFANSIPLTKILSKLNCKLENAEGSTLLYYSPYKPEKEPSLQVNTQNNTWFDLETNETGNVVDLICRYLEYQGNRHSVHEALRYIKNIHFFKKIENVETPFCQIVDEAYSATLVWPLVDGELIDYLQRRGISQSVAEKHLHQVQVYNSIGKNHFYAVGNRNEDGGFFIQNPYIEAYIGKRYPIVIRGSNPRSQAIHIFDDITDYLSVIEFNSGEALEATAVITTCLSCLHHVTPYFSGGDFRKVFTWLDNDKAGRKATRNFHEYIMHQEDLVHIPMNPVYVPHKNVNTWHMHRVKNFGDKSGNS